MKKRKTVAQLKRKLDQVFSRYIRLRDTPKGYGRCVTCGRKLPYKDLDAGHFISRNWTALRWDERNVNIQCLRCNRFQGGQIEEYFLWMEDKYGRAVVDEMISHKHDVIILTTIGLQALIDEYKDKIKELNK